MLSAISWTVVGLALVVGVIGLGFFLPPAPFKIDTSPVASTTGGLDAGSLPEPVRHYVERIADTLPKTDTAVIWGRGRVRNGSVWLPIRFRAYIDNNNGPEMSRYTEVTWYSVPLLRSIDYFIEGKGALIGAGLAGLFDEGPMATQAEYTSMWAQMVTLPSMFLTLPDLKWEAIDASTASLALPPLNDEQDKLIFNFDESDLIQSISVSRYRVEDGIKMPWRVEFSNWKIFDQILLPTRHEFMWEDTGSYVIFEIEGVAYNLDVSRDMFQNLPPT